MTTDKLIAGSPAIDKFVEELIAASKPKSERFELTVDEMSVQMRIPTEYGALKAMQSEIATKVGMMDELENAPAWIDLWPFTEETFASALLLEQLTEHPPLTARHWIRIAKESGLCFDAVVNGVNRFLAETTPRMEVRMIDEAKNGSSGTGSGVTA